MRIHTDKLTAADIHRATTAAGMRGVCADVREAGSRSRARRFDVSLTGTSTRRTNPGTSGYHYRDDYAATWDEWGMFIQDLFNIDPDAIIGQYQSKNHFEEVTYDRYIHLTAPYQHGGGGHTWRRNPDTGVSECAFCEARYDFLTLHSGAQLAKATRRAH